MDKLNPCRVGSALAATVAVFYVACAAAVILFPEGTFDFSTPGCMGWISPC